MAVRIALAGKGGTGKTTTAALLIRYLVETGKGPVLAVDADPNANLNELLGLEVETTLGEVKNELRTSVPESMSRGDFMEMRVHEAMVEAEGYDLLVMGQPEGPGCYCAAHSFLSQALQKIEKSYAYMVVDNEAGMEHLSRLNMTEIDHLLVVSDASSRGVLTAARIAALVKPLQLQVGHKWLLVNRAPEEIPEALDKYVRETCEKETLSFLGYLSESKEIFELEVNQRPIWDLPSEHPLLVQAYRLFEEMLA
ncbi:AAA family ATPase [Thermosulfurimonas dismutans]|uniref:CO dehydrogenase accessory protein CooC (Nickel insertion) n=1 Tax=Thermosulfurimonas dismutans TaxID=999894 RepID=A0A179D4I7_9BACT|nr:AAA family ATPase [Thermosulfurimonas dismutans]OAQ21004.1 CO dehydrogenase accessory protein CooC (nickel insertion) [Thermosulfurimonas dismutans]